jgi:hypothetical protein
MDPALPVAVAGMLRDPTQPNSRIGISRRRPIQAREQPPTQVGSLTGSLPESLSGVHRILTIGRGRRPCGRKAMHHERRRLDLERRGRAEPCRRAVTLQGASATPSSAGQGSLVTRQSFIPVGEERGTHKAASKLECKSCPAKGNLRERRRH